MDALWLSVPESFLEQRRQLGHDKKDEVWDGVIHMVPPASYVHSVVASDLLVALAPIAKRRGLVALCDGLGVFGSEVNYRIPDCTISRPDQASKRGVEGAELVIEILSPNDESRKKWDFYAKVGVWEVWLIEPSTRVTEIYTLVNGAYEEIQFANGIATSPFLGITLEVVAGPLLRLRDGDTIADV